MLSAHIWANKKQSYSNTPGINRAFLQCKSRVSWWMEFSPLYPALVLVELVYDIVCIIHLPVSIMGPDTAIIQWQLFTYALWSFPFWRDLTPSIFVIIINSSGSYIILNGLPMDITFSSSSIYYLPTIYYCKHHRDRSVMIRETNVIWYGTCKYEYALVNNCLAMIRSVISIH